MSALPVPLLLAILVFVSVFFAIEGCTAWWRASMNPKARRLARRLDALADPSKVSTESLLKANLARNGPAAQRLLRSLASARHAETLLLQSGTSWTLARLGTVAGGCAVAATLLGLALGLPAWWALLIGALASLLPLQYLVWKRETRRRAIDSQLPEALALMGRALRAGHSFSAALTLVATEMPEPLGGEFRQTSDEITLGIAPPIALQTLADRVPSFDLRFFVVAVLIQRESGGNLAEVLDNIAGIVRERLQLLGRVRTLSAEGRFSGLVLSALPFVTGTMLYVVQPEFVSMLWTEPTGRTMLVAGLVLMVLGMLAMRKIVRIHV